jgi:hypothetical protein
MKMIKVPVRDEDQIDLVKRRFRSLDLFTVGGRQECVVTLVFAMQAVNQDLLAAR